MAPRNITPEQLAATKISSSYRLDLDGTLFDFGSSYKSHSLRYMGNDTLRFELRDKDQFEWDVRSGAASERTQLSSKTLFANNEAVNVSFGLNIEAGAANTAKWLVLGQLHLAQWTGNLTGKSPPLEIGLEGERMVVYARYDKPDGTVVRQEVYKDLHDVQRGHKYDIDIKAVFDPSGNGRLVITRDGTTLADYSGPLGYQQQLKVLWGEGIYREGSATETMAAQFSNLEIKTGADVKFPDKSAFIAAPKLAVDHVGAAAADGSRTVNVSGTAKAGTTVTISEGDHTLGRAKVDANGHFSLAVKIDRGTETELSAIATDSTGRSGLEAKAQSIIVGTGAEIGAKLYGLVAEGGIASIVISDGTVITASPAIFSYIFKYGQDVLSKIQGDFSFYNSTRVTGQSYDRQDFHYNSEGVLTEKIRYTAGQKTFEETYRPDGSTHQVSRNGMGGTDVKDISKSGLITHFEQYTPQGTLSILQIKNANGSFEDHFYDPKTGLETRYTLKAADGSKEVGALQLKGRAYTTEVYDYDKSGKMVEQHRYDADGTQIYQQVWKANGSRQIDNFDAVTGLRTSFTIYSANGARVETTLAVGDPYQLVKTVAYSASGAILSVTEGGKLPRAGDGTVGVPAEPVVTSPSNPIPNPQPSVPSAPVTEVRPVTYVVDAKTGLRTGSTETHTDGSKEVIVFKAGHESQILSRTTFDSAGQKVLAEVFNGAGTKLGMTSYAADGSRVTTELGVTKKSYDTLVTAYDAAGKIVMTKLIDDDRVISETKIAADGTKLEKAFAADGKFTSTTLSATGRLISQDVYDANGKHLSSDVRGADGSRDLKTYDAGTGAVRYELHTDADKTRTETSYGIKDRPYVQQTIEYDGAGKMTEKMRYYGDADRTLQFHEKYNSNGSTEVRSYDTAGRETSSILITAAKVKDVFEFRYAGAGDDPSRVQQDHYEGGKKLWTEVRDEAGNHQQYSNGATTLTSHEGARDAFTSGSGSDTFVFGANAGRDVIWKFSVTEGKQDTIKFDHAGVDSIDDLDIAALGKHTIINYGFDESITLYHVTPTQLKSEFFLFV